MAPPAGTSSMLRARRRDATLKPNRTLDRNASRGMLYENEELRLRTININAEVEKGQNYIKKLRRENEQLKKEIWNLREEYDRLENYVKSREQSENEEEDSCVEEPSTAEDVVAMSSLETVVEEDVGVDESIVDGDGAEPIADQHSVIPGVVVCVETESDRSRSDRDAVAGVGSSAGGCGGPREGFVAVTADAVAAAVGRRGADDREHEVGDNAEQHVPATDPGADGQCVTSHHLREEPPAAAAHQDAAMTTLPHTACFDTGNNRQLHDLTVDEVIDAVRVAELRDKLRSVCVADGRCYMTFAGAEHLERALHTTFRIRDVPVLPVDTGAGAVILSLTGVPDAVTDKDVLKCLKKYGTIVGGVERKTARCGATGGERYVRVRPTLGAPRYLWFGSDKVIVRQLTEHETGTMNSVARRKSFRSQIKLNLKMIDPSTSAGSACRSGTNGDGDGAAAGDGRTVGDTAVSAKTGFRFPTADPKTPISTSPAPEPCKIMTAAAAPSSASVKSTGSPKRSTKAAQNDRDGGCPQTPVPASGPAESPLRGRRRPSVMQGAFRRDTITKHRGGSVSRAEDADSDTSTICRRKLSITGRERAEKVPWCGCWGNGCL